MGKSTHFIGQPILGQLLNFLEKEKIIKISVSVSALPYFSLA